MHKTLIAITLLILLSGCSWLETRPAPAPPVRIITQQIPLEIYQPPPPQELRLEDVRWFVITPDNLDEQVAELEKLQGGEYVIFAITPKDYENMAYNLQELRRYIREQKEIILYYKRATHTEQSVDAWLERNQQLQQPLPKSPSG